MIIRQNDSESGIHIDFVPMVDTLFNLLIFFLLATTIKQAEREMNVALPFAAAATPISVSLREIIVNVDEKGQIIVASRPMEAEALTAMVRDAVAANPAQKVTIRGDRNTPYANIVRALDAVKRAGVQEPFIDTLLDH